MIRKLPLALALSLSFSGAVSPRDPVMYLNPLDVGVVHRAKIGKDRWSSSLNRLSQKGRRKRARRAGFR